MQRTYVGFGLLAALALVGVSYGSEACKPLTPDLRSSITEYVVKKFKVPPSMNVALKDESIVEGSCYRKLIFDSDPPSRAMIVYLSPEQRYVLPYLFDLNLDPAAEERALTAAAMKLLTSEDSPSRGSVNASVTLVEFSDFQCPFCKRLTDVLHSEMLEKNENVRIVFKNYPLPTHFWAMEAAKAAACVSFQNEDAFWLVHNYLFDHQQQLNSNNIRDKLTELVARISGVDLNHFSDCMDKGAADAIISRDIATANQLHVHATPTFFINGIRKDGAVASEELHALLQQALANANEASSMEHAKATTVQSFR